MQLFVLFTFFLLGSSVRLPLFTESSNVNTTSLNKPIGKWHHKSLANIIAKKKQSIQNMFHKVASTSKGAFHHAKHVFSRTRHSIKSYTSSLSQLPSEIKSNLRKLKHKITGNWKSKIRNQVSSRQANSQNGEQFNISKASCSSDTNNGTDCSHYNISFLNFHEDCTDEQMAHKETILSTLAGSDHVKTSSSSNLNGCGGEDNTSGYCVVGQNTVFERSIRGGWVLNSELVQRFVMAAGWRNNYHGYRWDGASLNTLHAL
jgi:hypothetical protein